MSIPSPRPPLGHGDNSGTASGFRQGGVGQGGVAGGGGVHAALDLSPPHSPPPSRNDVINTTPIEISVDRFQVSAGLIGLGCVESSLEWDRAAATATVTTATVPLDVATSRPAIIETATEEHVPTNGTDVGVFSVWSGSVRDEDTGEEWI